MQKSPRHDQTAQSKRPTFNYLNPQQLGNELQRPHSRNDRDRVAVSPSVNAPRSVSQSRASSASLANSSMESGKRSLFDNSIINQHNEGNTLNEQGPLDKSKSRTRKSIFDTKNLHESYVVERPNEPSDLKCNNNRQRPELQPSQHEGDKFKQSQFTAATHQDLESRKQSRMLDLSDMEEVKLEKHQSEEARNVWFDIANAIWKEPKERIEYLQKQDEKPLKENELMSLLGSLVCAPKPTQEKKEGVIANDPEVEKALIESLATYFSNSQVSKTEPFYENETKIRAQDEVFVFKLSFRYESDRVVFDWTCQKNYPSEDITLRKYECVNYFIIDVFPDHIRVFNDFTVLPFCLNKNQEKYEVRTQLRSFIPLDDPSKATTIKYEPTPSETEASRAKEQEPEYVPIE